MPLSVLESLQQDLIDYRGTGLSVLEMSHRSPGFAEIAEKAERDLRQLLAVPDGYSVLFMQGGATSQFALCVQNLDTQGKVAYCNTGYWSAKAMASARLSTEVVQVASCINDPLQRIPESINWLQAHDASFLHLTDNETLGGVAHSEIPESCIPIVSDMSSSILSRPIDVSGYAMIYAGAQKNIGPAGITIVIIRDDLLERSASMKMPPVFNYAAMSAANSLLNTPPTFAWYASGLVFEWLLAQGGLAAIEQQNSRQASRVYEVIDQNDLYVNLVHPDNRSRMNIPFTLADERLTDLFLAEAAARNMIGLKGHKSVGGLRISLYNAVTDVAVDALTEMMLSFAREHS